MTCEKQPIVKGGQGRSDREVVEGGGIVVASIAALVLYGLVALAVALL